MNPRAQPAPVPRGTEAARVSTMGKSKPQQSRLAAILAENKKRTTKKSSHTKLRDDVDEEVELSAVQMMEKYQGTVRADAHALSLATAVCLQHPRAVCCATARH